MKAGPTLVLAAGAAIAVAAFVLADPRNFVVFIPHGIATSGSRFGVKIGMRTSEGEARMRALPGVAEPVVNVEQDGVCFVRPDQRLSMFDDISWRQGMVCLISKNGRVEKIVWEYESVLATLR